MGCRRMSHKSKHIEISSKLIEIEEILDKCRNGFNDGLLFTAKIKLDEINQIMESKE